MGDTDFQLQALTPTTLVGQVEPLKKFGLPLTFCFQKQGEKKIWGGGNCIGDKNKPVNKQNSYLHKYASHVNMGCG